MLRGKNAIITGARRGIGRATVEVFARNGANIWACARSIDAEFERDMSELEEKYRVWIRPVYFEMKNAEQMKQAVQKIVKEKQPVDILLNNAGDAQYDMFTVMPADHLRDMLETNYIAPLQFTQLIARRMIRNQGGTIIFVSSVAGLNAESGNIAYGGSKAAIAHATKVLSRELSNYNIRVNAVAPGLVNTDMKNKADKLYWDEMTANIYLKRMAEPEEVANVICFLASDLSSYVNGQIIRVDGGM